MAAKARRAEQGGAQAWPLVPSNAEEQCQRQQTVLHEDAHLLQRVDCHLLVARVVLGLGVLGLALLACRWKRVIATMYY